MLRSAVQDVLFDIKAQADVLSPFPLLSAFGRVEVYQTSPPIWLWSLVPLLSWSVEHKGKPMILDYKKACSFPLGWCRQAWYVRQ